MTGSKTMDRKGIKSHESHAASRRRATRSARAMMAAAGNGLETLESRVLMSAVRPDAAFAALDLGVGDDRSFPTTGTTGYSLGFSAPINFFGSLYSGVFVNNNGHVSLGARNSFYTDVDLDSLNAKVIAPFYANVDTRYAGSTVKYGRGTVDGRAAFAVNWVGVDYHISSAAHTNRNSFQLVLIDRSDLGAGNFDMEFNYDKITWESSTGTGGVDGLGGSTARIGWQANNGSLEGIYQMAGSNVAGSFLDGNTITGLVHNSFMSDVDGRYVYRFRGGTWADAPTGGPENTAPTVDLPDTVLVVEDEYGTGRLNLTGMFDDPDADNWLATVDYGDGWGTRMLDLDSAKGFSLLNPYFTPGVYNVTVTIDDGNGGVASDTMTVVVEDHLAPRVNVSGPLVVREGGSGLITFDLNDDTDVNDSYSFHWSGSGMEGDWGQFLFHADDSGAHTVTLTVTDQAGNATVVEVPVTVENVAPTATGLVGAGEVDEGAPLALGLGGADDVSAADLAAGLIYSFDFDGDGVFDVVGTASAVSHVYDDNGIYTVRARVADKDGGYSDYTHQVHVRNVPPRRGHLTDNNPVAEGSAVTVTFGGQEDPSSADTAAGFTYSYDFDGDGVFEVSGSSPAATHTFANNGIYTVTGRVTDKDGGYTDYTTEVEVYNVAPVITDVSNSAASLGAATAGSTVSLSAAFTDAGVLDGHSMVIDWGDGTTSTVAASSANGAGSATGTHMYAQGGIYTVTLTVLDDAQPAGGATVTAQVFVTGVGLHNGILQIVGTNGDDRVRVSADNRGNLKVQSDFARDVVFSSSSVHEIHAMLGSGRDSFDAASGVTQPIFVNGMRYYPAKGNKAGTTGITRTLFSDRLVA